VPSAIWTGSISFGLVTVPIKMISATRSLDVRFHQLEEGTGSRIRYRRVAEQSGDEVPNERIVKGFEFEPGRYVVVEADEIAGLKPKASRQIEIEDFVDLADIDPVYFEHSYFLVPEKGGAKAYALLRQAMEQAGKIALGRVVLRQKQYLAAIRPAGRALALATLYYPDEVVQADEFEGLPGEDVNASGREVKMSQQLVDTLSNDFEPEKYHDEYREALHQLIEDKASGETIVQLPVKQAAASKVTDLMAALEASIAAAKGGGSKDQEKEEPRRRKKSA